MKKYQHYYDITKETLDTINVGDFVKINDWKRAMRVVGVSQNYFCMIQKVCGNICYSVCEKKRWSGIRYNRMLGNFFHCGTDNMVFGYGNFDYKFDNKDQIKEYLQAFERGEIELSARTSVPIFDLFIK